MGAAGLGITITSVFFCIYRDPPYFPNARNGVLVAGTLRSRYCLDGEMVLYRCVTIRGIRAFCELEMGTTTSLSRSL